MMDQKDFIAGVLGMALNMPETEVSSLFSEDGNPKDDALDTIKIKYGERVKAEKDKAASDRQEQYRRGLKEKGLEWEKSLREAGIEIGDAVGAEAVAKLKEHIDTAISAVAKPGELDDEKIKVSKLYRELERNLEKTVQAKEAEFKQAWADRDAKEQHERVLATVRDKAKGVLDELKPNLPEDPKKAANQLKFLYADLEAFTYEVEGDELLIKDKEGKRLENELGHPVKFSDLVKSKSEEYFDFQASDKKGAAGDLTKGVKTTVKLQRPATRQELGQQIYKINEDKTLKAEDKLKLIDELKTLNPELA